MMISRRNLCFSLVSASLLAGCARESIEVKRGTTDQALIRHYAERDDGGHRIPAVNTNFVETRYLRKVVPNELGVQVGTILVETSSSHLYFGLDHDTLIRYGVALPAGAFIWSGEGYIQRLRDWPTWTPTARMIRENPHLARYSKGMPGGLQNPLGARALYIFQGQQDTQYRIHGTNLTWSIGKGMSSGCIRMFNQDVIELAEFVRPNATIMIL